MSDQPTHSPLPPTRRQALVARREQVVLAILAIALVAGAAFYAARHWRVGDEALEVVSPADGPAFRLNVNTTNWQTLSLVPGLGETLSRRIIEVRDSEFAGKFNTLDDLRKVRGIGPKSLEKLRPYLVLNDSDPPGEPVHLPAQP